jgi:hypothetical protein
LFLSEFRKSLDKSSIFEINMNSEGSWNKRAGTAETEEGSVFVVWSLLTKFFAPQLSVFEIKLQSGPPPQTFGESQPCLKLYTFDGLIIDISSSTRPLHNVDTWDHESTQRLRKMAASNAQTPAATTWTEPPWSGWIETTGDALLILEAARRGLIPRVTRRLVDSERKMITSGSVFVFDEDESGIKRWTDGFFWSPSRILGNFLLYRETDKRGAGHRGARSDPPPADVSESQYNVDGVKLEGQTLSRPKGESSQMGIDRHRERTLMGSLTNSYKFKNEGLMKKVSLDRHVRRSVPGYLKSLCRHFP